MSSCPTLLRKHDRVEELAGRRPRKVREATPNDAITLGQREMPKVAEHEADPTQGGPSGARSNANGPRSRSSRLQAGPSAPRQTCSKRRGWQAFDVPRGPDDQE